MTGPEQIVDLMRCLFCIGRRKEAELPYQIQRSPRFGLSELMADHDTYRITTEPLIEGARAREQTTSTRRPASGSGYKFSTVSTDPSELEVTVFGLLVTAVRTFRIPPQNPDPTS
jgi:hypothetical protein